jgi:hypothetical protein
VGDSGRLVARAGGVQTRMGLSLPRRHTYLVGGGGGFGGVGGP